MDRRHCSRTGGTSRGQSARSCRIVDAHLEDDGGSDACYDLLAKSRPGQSPEDVGRLIAEELAASELVAGTHGVTEHDGTITMVVKIQIKGPRTR